MITDSARGYYQVNDKIYTNKLLALYSNKNNDEITWNFHDDVFSQQDWTKKPAGTLQDLYKQRAQQLRDSYDYLILNFSGGADSWNILHTFLTNNIKLDEVASFVNYDATGDRFNYLNAEIYNVAVPRIQKIQQQQPWLVHSLLDISKMTMDIFSEKESKFNWIYHVNSYINPNAVSRKDIKLKNTLVLSNGTGTMTGRVVINKRGGVWRINIFNNIVSLTFVKEVNLGQRVRILSGSTFASAIVYYSIELQPGQNVPFYKVYNVQPNGTPTKTTFNNATTRFFNYRDQYYAPGTEDKYVKFPQYGVFY
jgi:hypothetical protein